MHKRLIHVRLARHGLRISAATVPSPALSFRLQHVKYAHLAGCNVSRQTSLLRYPQLARCRNSPHRCIAVRCARNRADPLRRLNLHSSLIAMNVPVSKAPVAFDPTNMRSPTDRKILPVRTISRFDLSLANRTIGNFSVIPVPCTVVHTRRGCGDL